MAQLFLFLFVAFSIKGQNYVRPQIASQEGIFPEFEDFLKENPIPHKLVVRGSEVFFWDETLDREVKVPPDEVWGYSINNNVYISYDGEFWKLINRGKLNHFSAIVVYYYQTYDSFGFMVNRASKTLTHLFFDIKDGVIKNLNKENFEKYFDEDPKLEKYYRKLKGNRTEKLILVLQAYNERNMAAFE